MEISELEFIKIKKIITKPTAPTAVYVYKCTNGHQKEFNFEIEEHRECGECLDEKKENELIKLARKLNFRRVEMCANCKHLTDNNTYDHQFGAYLNFYICRIVGRIVPTFMHNYYGINFVCDSWEEIKMEENERK